MSMTPSNAPNCLSTVSSDAAKNCRNVSDSQVFDRWVRGRAYLCVHERRYLRRTLNLNYDQYP
jgi:hypothetical protein